MNKNQRLVLAIFIPAFLFFITLIIANSVGVTWIGGLHQWSPTKKIITHTNNPFDWGKTWYVWVTYFIIIFIFEYKLFSDKDIPNNKKK